MQIYEKNMEVIMEHCGSLGRKVAKTISLDGSDLDFYYMKARDGLPIPVVKKNGTEYRLNSSYHPILEAERWMKQYTNRGGGRISCFCYVWFRKRNICFLHFKTARGEQSPYNI